MPEATWYRNLEGSLLLVIRPRSAAPRASSNVGTFYTHRGAVKIGVGGLLIRVARGLAQGSRSSAPAPSFSSGMPRGQERGEVRHQGSLTLRQAIEGTLARAADSEALELIGEPRALDPPQGLEQLDEGYPCRIRGRQQVGRSGPCPGRT